MSQNGNGILVELFATKEAQILTEWTAELLKPGVLRSDRIKESEIRDQSRELIGLIVKAVKNGNVTDIQTSEWADTREMLATVSRSRAKQGFNPTEVATFVLSLKKPIFAMLRQEVGNDVDVLTDETWKATLLLDKLALWTTEAFQKSREEIILRQQEEMMELSTPVVKLWDGILALPLIGTLDSARTQVVMENLLQAIVDTGADVAIIDITGVPTVDTLVSQHLLKTVAAARLMGADCIISGIRPQIAQTIVHLGVDLTAVSTKATLADAFRLALKKTGSNINAAQTRA